LSADEHDVRFLRDTMHLEKASGTGLAYGNGRSYGDVCLNPGGTLWATTRLDHFMRFDAETGQLVCEAGVLLRDIQRMSLPRGWLLPVTPGTQLVTVGGAIANDVHGKNHHAVGSFGDHVLHFKLLRTDGSVIECGPHDNAEWFTATVGGMGLTGVITEATIQLRRVPGAWISAETIPFANLDDFFRLADDSEAAWEHTVAWIDCVSASGRGIFMRGNFVDHATTEEPRSRQLRMPLTPPWSLVNGLTLRPFNTLYYALQKQATSPKIIRYEPFFYPLDHVLEWNRMYGKRGFYQYQSVVPREVGPAAVQSMLAAIAKSGEGSFLAVLKTFGKGLPLGLMSFPRPGVTLALDFANRGAKTEALFTRLDGIVREAGGRIYPAKDARMPRDLFESGYPHLAQFLQFRDPGISSAMSRRLMGS
jgi:FAD/FMN-containing dehydrogenase